MPFRIVEITKPSEIHIIANQLTIALIGWNCRSGTAFFYNCLRLFFSEVNGIQ